MGARLENHGPHIKASVGSSLLRHKKDLRRTPYGTGNSKIFKQALQNDNFIQIWIFYNGLNEITNKHKKLQRR
jgi:hypothetical protein